MLESFSKVETIIDNTEEQVIKMKELKDNLLSKAAVLAKVQQEFLAQLTKNESSGLLSDSFQEYNNCFTLKSATVSEMLTKDLDRWKAKLKKQKSSSNLMQEKLNAFLEEEQKRMREFTDSWMSEFTDDDANSISNQEERKKEVIVVQQPPHSR